MSFHIIRQKFLHPFQVIDYGGGLYGIQRGFAFDITDGGITTVTSAEKDLRNEQPDLLAAGAGQKFFLEISHADTEDMEKDEVATIDAASVIVASEDQDTTSTKAYFEIAEIGDTIIQKLSSDVYCFFPGEQDAI